MVCIVLRFVGGVYQKRVGRWRTEMDDKDIPMAMNN
jgi:hypothetical protein